LYYEEAYGYTRLRLYVQACCVTVSLALLLLAWELRGPIHVAHLTRSTGMAAILCATSLAYWNVAAWVVYANVDRFQQTRKLDTTYLSQLADSSPDAVPALVESLPQLTAADAGSLRESLRAAAPRRDTAWYEWNLRRTLALSTLCAAGLLPGSDDTVCAHTRAPGMPAAEAAVPSAPVSAPAQPSSAHSVP
jgi:two-component system, OmpR family, sensor histidine kinase BaeS